MDRRQGPSRTADPARNQLLAGIGRAHFLQHRSKVQIAEDYGLSRFRVADLLQEALARTALPDAVVAAHAHQARSTTCASARRLLPSYVDARLSPERSTRVAAHLDVCRSCTALFTDLVRVREDLPALLTSAFLGAGAAAYLAGTVRREDGQLGHGAVTG